MVNSYLRVGNSYGKSKQMLTSVIRSTTCNGGWLRLVVQVIFGVIIVCSFILITLLTIHSHYQRGSKKNQRCIIQSCSVTCNGAPFFGEYERDIVQATTDTEQNCRSIVLKLNNAMFNNCTLPEHWLSSIRADVSEFEIVGGNLKHIPADAFQTQFGGKIRVLVLEDITITTLTDDTFIGLSSLEEIHIKNSEIINIQRNALQAVDDTLEVLNIKSDYHWDPVNVTGSSELNRLRTVDFSMNKFNDILNYKSFAQLKYCTVLFLNSCNIISIGVGTFDPLKSIEILHLNNNYLVSLPYNIFNTIIPREPRISLQDNLWNCSCNSNLRVLFKLGLLIVEPTCFYPTAFRGEKISSFEQICEVDPNPTLIDEGLYVFDSKSASAINHQCEVNSSRGNYIPEICSPLPEFECLSNMLREPLIKHPDQTSVIDLFSNKNNWLKPSFSIDTNVFSMVSLVFTGAHEYGLMWYHSKCPKVIYCINHLPKLLRIYNEDSNTEYTFCRILIMPTGVQSDQCVSYNLTSFQRSNAFFYKSLILIVSIAFICLFSGALCVYALIHRNPILLKGNKRVVFVKHKSVDALILPAKSSLKENLPKDSDKSEGNTGIFVIPKNIIYPSVKLSRANSVCTNESNDPSYISALQPTGDQLAEWRVTRNFEATYAYDSADSTLSTHSRIFSSNALPHFSYDHIENIYDTVKL